tara:strand:- start:164 stop:1642 length:1479 start_codon:yes stop_codon:yes gene_type:complete
LRRERQRGSGSNSRYTVYSVIMLLLIVGIPIFRMLVVELSSADALAVLVSPIASQVLAAMVGASCAALVLLGRIRGPALVDAFEGEVVAGNHLPRRHTLRRTFLRSAAALTLSCMLIAVVAASALAVAGIATASTAVVFVIGAVLVGIVASTGWLLGQSVSTRSSRWAAAAIAATALLAAVVPGALAVVPWGWFGLLYPGGGAPSVLALVPLAALVAVAGCGVPSLLDSIRGVELSAQARRWSSATTFAATADVAGGLAQLRALPTGGRGWTAVRNAPLPVLVLVRDLVGSLRSPERPVVAALALVAAGFALASVSVVPSALAWVTAVFGATVAFLALGVWSDGFRHAAETAHELPLYGFAVTKQFALHSLLPILGVIVFAGSGAAAALAVGATVASVSVSITFALFVITVRIMNATKGRMPLALLTPIPTPMGDFSGLIVVFWQADALLVTAMVGFFVTVEWLSLPLLVLLLVGAGAAALVMARRNLQNAR